MSDILATAAEYRNEVIRRAMAHELSAEYHRRRGVQLGVAATAVSAIVGSAVFIAVTRAVGLGDGAIAPATGPLPVIAYLTVGLLSVLAPVLSGVQTYLRDPEQATRHTLHSAEFARVRGDLDSFIARYEGVELAGETREKAARELQEISKEKEKIRSESLTLTPRAFRDADVLLGRAVAKGALA